MARKSIKTAANCGVNAVKFQNFKTEDFLTDRTITYTYKSQGEEVTEPLYDICKRSEFKQEWLGPLKELCDSLDVEFMSTPTSEEGIMDLVNAGVKVLKNGSDYLTHIPLLEFMGGTGLQVIISTGMAYKEDVEDAVNAVKKAGNGNIILLHCVSNYPTLDENVNLNRMTTLRKRYNLPVGFSDHTLGWSAASHAVTIGACVIEKHFTFDRNLTGPDHWFSADPDELQVLVEEVRRAEKQLGSADISPAVSEMVVREKYRLGLVAARDMRSGHALRKEDLVFRKPCTGFLPKDRDRILGRKLARDLEAGRPIRSEDILGEEN